MKPILFLGNLPFWLAGPDEGPHDPRRDLIATIVAWVLIVIAIGALCLLAWSAP